MANSKGKEVDNKLSLCSMMEQAYEEDRLIEANLETGGKVYALLNEQGNTLVVLDKTTGKFLFTKAGANKSNKRQYINLPIPGNTKYMIANYTFRIIAEGLLSDNSKHKDRYIRYRDGVYTYRLYTKEECIEKGYNPKEGIMGPIYDATDINHINGNTNDNRDCNLEVDTKGMNNAHSRLMAEVAYYHPELISVSDDCQGHKMHKWVDSIGISCKQIRDWNKRNPNDTIKAFRDKNGEWTPGLTEEQVDRILRYFNKI